MYFCTKLFLMQMQNTQNSGIDSILKNAFRYWNSTLVYQLLFSLIYFSIFMMITLVVGQKYGIIDQHFAIFQKAQGNFAMMQKDLQALQASSSFMSFSWYILGAIVFLYPLNIGFFQMYRKIDLKEKVTVLDLFAGYIGSNFIKFISFYLFWFIIYGYAMQTLVLGVVWVLITLFSAPLMFFMNKTILESIAINFKILKTNFIAVFVCTIVAILFKYVGILLFFVGFLFTFPFWNAMIYAMYQTFFSEKEEIKK